MARTIEEEKAMVIKMVFKAASNLEISIENFSNIFGFEETGHQKNWINQLNEIIDDMMYEMDELEGSSFRVLR